MSEQLENREGPKQHSVKVPRLYKEASKALKLVEENGEGLKSAVHSVKHPNVKALTALVSESLRHRENLNVLIRKSKLSENEPGLFKQIHLVKILITELLWGKKRLGGDSRPVITINSYQEKFGKILTKLERKNKCLESNSETDNTNHSSSSEFKSIRKPRYVRVNTLKKSLTDALTYLEEEGWIKKEKLDSYDDLTENDFLVDEFVPNLLVFCHGTEFHKHPLYLDGSLVLQDKASCLPALALKPRPDRQILDSCAAPGMKTSHLASLTKNETSILAVEKSSKRCNTLKTMLENLGATNVTVLNQDFTDLDPQDYKDVEYILVDPSCSGSGMYNRVELTVYNKQDRLQGLSYCQRKLLLHAMKFPYAKRIVYSTCSINSVENEDVVAGALNDHDTTLYAPFKIKKALPLWPHRVQNPNYTWSDFCAKADYEHDRTDGFFIALLERAKSSST